MADITAVSADGKKHVFPEGTQRDVIDRVMKDYAQKNPIARAKVGPQVDTSTDLPIGERFKRGAMDIAEGGAQLAAHIFPGSMLPMPAPMNPTQYVDQKVAESQQAYADKRETAGGSGIDAFRTAGNTAAMAPLAAAVGPEAGMGWLASLGLGAGSGALTGSLMPTTEPDKPFLPQKLGQMGSGAVGGLVGGGLVKGGSSLISPKIAPEVTSMMAKGGKPTLGQIVGAGGIEDRLTGIPIVGNAIAGSQKRALDSFQRVVYDDVLAPIGEKGPKDLVGYDAIDAVHKAVSNKYEELLPNLVFKVDDQLVDDLDNLSSMAAEMPKEQAQRFQDVVVKKLVGRLSKTDTMDGKTFKGVEAELLHEARGLLRDPSFNQRELGAAINEALVAARDALERNNPMFSGRLAKVNQSFSKLVTLENATARLGTNDGVFTPAQLMGAVRATDKSVRNNKFARGEAQMQDLAREGKKVFGAKYPDSGTVGRSIPAMAALAGAGWADMGLTAGGLTAAALPYTRPGQWLMSGLMTTRPRGSEAFASLLDRTLLPAAAAGGAYGAGQ